MGGSACYTAFMEIKIAEALSLLMMRINANLGIWILKRSFGLNILRSGRARWGVNTWLIPLTSQTGSTQSAATAISDSYGPAKKQ